MVTQRELMALAMLLRDQGVEVDPEAVRTYYADVDENFYVPTKIPKNFYYDAEGLRNVSKVGDLRSMTSVDSKVFRRLLGI